MNDLRVIGTNIKILKYNNKVLYGNSENGKWVRVSDEVSSIVENYLDSSDDFYEKYFFESDEDKNFIHTLIDRMHNDGIIKEKGTSEKRNKIATIETTNNCNLRCIHCCVNAGEECCFEFSTTELKTVLRKCIEWGANSINLSGGEPLLRKDIFEILQFLRKEFDGSITLSTNGTLFTSENVQKICPMVDQIDISIDGIDELTCSQIRGAGVFSKVLKSVELLHNQDFWNISLSMVFSKKNEQYEKQFIELNKKLKTKPLPRIIADIGRAREHVKEFTDDENEAYIPKSFLKEERTNDLGFYSCGAARNTIFIRYDGSIYPCPSFMKQKYRLGNVLELDSIESVTEDNIDDSVKKHMLNANMIFSEKCKKCPVKYFCWSCIGDTDRFPTKEALDMYCKMTKPILMKRVWGCN